MAVAGEHESVSRAAPTRRRRIVALAARLIERSPWLVGRWPARQPRAAEAFEAFNRGVRLGALGDRGGAVAAYRASIATGDRNVVAQAAFNLAALVPDDLETATSAYLAAIATEDPDVAPKAAYNLASLLAANGDLAGATALLHEALGYGHEDVSARATLKLESLRAEALLDRLTSISTMAAPHAESRIAPRPASSRRRSESAHPRVDRLRRLRGSH